MIDRPTSEAIRFNMGSMARVKRRMRRSRPTITSGMLMLSRRLVRSRLTLLNSRLLIFSSSFSVFNSSLADSSSSCAVSSSSLPACASSFAARSSSRVDALILDDRLQILFGGYQFAPQPGASPRSSTAGWRTAPAISFPARRPRTGPGNSAPRKWTSARTGSP